MRTDTDAVAPPAGFTLIEMLVVLTILGLTLAIFLTQGTNRHPTLDLHAAAGAITQGLRLARSEAVATDRPVAVVIDAAAHTYLVGDSPVRSLAPELAIEVTTVAGATSGQTAAISFAPDGSSTGGRVQLSAGEHTVSISVDWLTGGVRVLDAR